MDHKPEVIGLLRNNWRGRFVTVYSTDDPTKVLTVGVRSDGKGEPVICTESRADYTRVLAMYPAIAVYD